MTVEQVTAIDGPGTLSSSGRYRRITYNQGFKASSTSEPGGKTKTAVDVTAYLGFHVRERQARSHGRWRWCVKVRRSLADSTSRWRGKCLGGIPSRSFRPMRSRSHATAPEALAASAPTSVVLTR